MYRKRHENNPILFDFQASSLQSFHFRMRDIKASYNQMLKLKVKQENMITKLEKIGALSDDLQRNILAVKSTDELDHLVISLVDYLLTNGLTAFVFFFLFLF